MKIQSAADFYNLKEQLVKNTAKKKYKVMVGMGTCGIASGANRTFAALSKEIKEHHLEDKVELQQTGCIGYCFAEPVVEIFEEDGSSLIYTSVDEKKAAEIVASHLINNKKLTEGTIIPDLRRISLSENVTLDKKQIRIALRNCGVINPESIEDYINRGGYSALTKALTEMEPTQIVDAVKKSGLRGRGGGGFPTGMKWEFVARENSANKNIICNADEGDPGAFMDRSLLEGDPHSILESMTIAGFATGANRGFIYIRAEYPLAVKRLEIALGKSRELGLLGKNIMGTDFSFDISIKLGAGAFVCGEEMALIHSIEGSRGEPTLKPPYPAQKGLYGEPTCVNNVETYANICPIIMKGADWFGSIGSEKSKGTKVFALAGKINNIGLVEVPMGLTVREIIYEVGGGIKNNKKFKAIQTGGPSGGVIPASMIDTPIDYDNLIAAGSMMGSGGMIVMDEDDCMVNIAKFYLGFTVEESCGRCTPCRIGNKRLYEILEKITSGNGTMEDLDNLRELGNVIKTTALCGLGQTSPNPILSTIKYFENEYIEHIKKKTCPAKVCRNLIRFYILADKCIGCGACVKICPVNCITGEIKLPHTISQTACIKCGSCYDRCRFNAIVKL